MSTLAIMREEFDAATYRLDAPRIKRYIGLDVMSTGIDAHFGRAWPDGWTLGAFARRHWADGATTAGVRVERRW